MENSVSIIEVVFIVSALLNLLSFILVFLMYTHLLSIKNTVNQLREGVGTTLMRMMNLESLLSKIGGTLTEFINTTGDLIDKISVVGMIGGSTKIYKTSDGKFTASSIEDLMNQVRGSKKDSEYFSDDEIERLKNMFNVDDDDMEDDDDEDDYLDKEDRQR